MAGFQGISIEQGRKVVAPYVYTPFTGFRGVEIQKGTVSVGNQIYKAFAGISGISIDFQLPLGRSSSRRTRMGTKIMETVSLLSHIDSGSGVSVDGSNNVLSVADQSGNGNNLTYTALNSNKAVRQLSSYLSFPSINYNGSVIPSVINLVPPKDNFTIIIVYCKTVETGGFIFKISDDTGTSNQGGHYDQRLINGLNRDRYYSGNLEKNVTSAFDNTLITTATQPNVYLYSYRSGVLTVFKDKVLMYQGSVDLNVLGSRIYLGWGPVSGVNNPSTFKLFEFKVYDKSLNSGSSEYNSMVSKYSRNASININFVGDSISTESYGPPSHTTQLVSQLVSNGYTVNRNNFFESGYTAEVYSGVAAQICPTAYNSKNITSIFISTNDLHNNLKTVSETWGWLSNIIIRSVEKGNFTCVSTILPRSNSVPLETSRQQLNTLIRDNASILGYVVADLGADANIGVWGSQNNTVYYLPDTIHLNTVGGGVAKGLIYAAISPFI